VLQQSLWLWEWESEGGGDGGGEVSGAPDDGGEEGAD